MINKPLHRLTSLYFQRGKGRKDYRIDGMGESLLIDKTLSDVNKSLHSTSLWTTVNICKLLSVVNSCKDMLMLIIVKAPRVQDNTRTSTNMYTLQIPPSLVVVLMARVEVLYKTYNSKNLTSNDLYRNTSDNDILYVPNMYYPSGVTAVGVEMTLGERD